MWSLSGLGLLCACVCASFPSVPWSHWKSHTKTQKVSFVPGGNLLLAPMAASFSDFGWGDSNFHQDHEKGRVLLIPSPNCGPYPKDPAIPLPSPAIQEVQPSLCKLHSISAACSQRWFSKHVANQPAMLLTSQLYFAQCSQEERPVGSCPLL